MRSLVRRLSKCRQLAILALAVPCVTCLATDWGRVGENMGRAFNDGFNSSFQRSQEEALLRARQQEAYQMAEQAEMKRFRTAQALAERQRAEKQAAYKLAFNLLDRLRDEPPAVQRRQLIEALSGLPQGEDVLNMVLPTIRGEG